MNRLNKLEVFYHERLVGTIALYQNRLAAFEYDSNWLANGFSISPFSPVSYTHLTLPTTPYV